MDVSIIIINWNTKDLLIDCIASIYKTTKNLSFEILVVDNGSSDNSVEAVRHLFPNIKVIENSYNHGFAKACNQGLRLINSRYAILLNTDTILCEGTIEKAIEFMDNNATVGICGGQLLNQDGSKQNSIANIPNLATELLNKSLLRKLFPEKYIGKELRIDKPIEVESIIGAFMVVRREAINDVGLMDEAYFFFFEETDWCMMMKKKGWKVIHHPDIKLYHLQGQTAKKVHIAARIEYWRSRYIFFRKHYGTTTLIILKIGLMVKLLFNLTANLLLASATMLSSKKAVEKSSLYYKILCWHLSGRPEGCGLNTGQDQVYR